MEHHTSVTIQSPANHHRISPSIQVSLSRSNVPPAVSRPLWHGALPLRSRPSAEHARRCAMSRPGKTPSARGWATVAIDQRAVAEPFAPSVEPNARLATLPRHLALRGRGVPAEPESEVWRGRAGPRKAAAELVQAVPPLSNSHPAELRAMNQAQAKPPDGQRSREARVGGFTVVSVAQCSGSK